MKNNTITFVAEAATPLFADDADPSALGDWRIERVEPRNAGDARAWSDAPDLIVVADAPHVIAAIRTRTDAVGRAPIVAIGPSEVDGADETIRAASPAALADLTRRWRPQELPSLVRLAEVLGGVEIRRLGIGLRDQLDLALRGLDDDGGDPALAHRIAGFAGMLGLTDLGQQWNARSHGACADTATLRIDTRRAIVALDRACD